MIHSWITYKLYIMYPVMRLNLPLGYALVYHFPAGRGFVAPTYSD